MFAEGRIPLRIQTFPNAMAETSGPGTRPAAGFLFSLSLKIGDSQWTAGAKGEMMSPLAVAVLYKENPTSVEKAVKDALKRPGLNIRNITGDSIIMIVELDFHMKDIFLSFVEDFEKKKVKQKLERQLKEIGFRGKLDVTIANKEDVDNKMYQIR